MGSLTKGSPDWGETITQLLTRSAADLSMSCDVGEEGARWDQRKEIKLQCARVRAEREGTTWAGWDIYMSSLPLPFPLSRAIGIYCTVRIYNT